MSLPGLDAVSTRFFELLAGRRLCTTACRACGAVSYPPADWCRACLSDQMHWVDLSGVGSLVAFSTQETAVRFRAPDVIGLVDLDEGIRLLTKIGAPYEDLAIGDRVRVEFFEAEPGLVLHQFVPA